MDLSQTARRIAFDETPDSVACSVDDDVDHSVTKVNCDVVLNFNGRKEELTDFTVCASCFVERLRDSLYDELADNAFSADYDLLDDIVSRGSDTIDERVVDDEEGYSRLELNLLVDVERMMEENGDDDADINPVYAYLFRWVTERTYAPVKRMTYTRQTTEDKEGRRNAKRRLDFMVSSINEP